MRHNRDAITPAGPARRDRPHKMSMLIADRFVNSPCPPARQPLSSREGV